jgi:hypothetical protein
MPEIVNISQQLKNFDGKQVSFSPQRYLILLIHLAVLLMTIFNNSILHLEDAWVYTSGVIATTKAAQSIVLFETSIGHAGEFIDSILHKRASGQAMPIIMSDALASNRPTVREAIVSLCNSHARRQFVDVISHFPEEVEHILQQ